MPDPGRGSLERGLGSVLVGLVVATLVIITVEPALRRFYPIPPSAEGLSAEEFRRAMDALPRLSFLLLLGLYAVASFSGGLAATLTAGRITRWPALATGFVLMVAGAISVITVYQPVWFRLASFLTYPLAYLGYAAARRRDDET